MVDPNIPFQHGGSSIRKQTEMSNLLNSDKTNIALYITCAIQSHCIINFCTFTSAYEELLCFVFEKLPA